MISLNGVQGSLRRDGISVAARPHDPRTVNLLEALHEICAPLHQPSSARLEIFSPNPANCEVAGEAADLISLIVKEAVVNAIRYSHPAGVAGVVSVACERNVDGTLAVDVVDDGVGLPENFNAMTDAGPGLRIIRALTDRLGGSVTFDSTSLGLHVRLLVPRSSVDIAGAAPTAVAGAEGGERPGPGNRRSALDAAIPQRLAAIVESSDDAILSKDLNGIITSWNEGARRLFGYEAEEMIGKSVTILIPTDRANEEPAILDRIRRGERVKHYETVRVRKDGSLVEISLSISPIKDANGRVVGASKIARDISERKQAQARQELLTREINHRTKNLFAVIQSVVSRSFAGKTSVADAKTAVLNRLYTLAQTNVLLMEQDFHGADIRQVVCTEMSPYQDRTEIEGPRIVVTAQAAQNLALAVHELATNAAKYGALCTASGRVRINWQVFEDGGRRFFAFRWQEEGGPPVQVPERKGFGSTVLEQVMAEYFDTPPRIDFATSGVVYELTGLLDGIAAEK
ncbi:PAS domain S-box-containing protein [Methylovirgula ligni]|uniref:Blue-light-activated histidine kinase n=1 Tax=Methylovirgula ligni TaxID=569860 RepID=A0A3D9YT37_9HYPH|nr:PAS domain S-box protein [Methylovirgula ligni]REF84653.1 PAS domain S-box-containing protein [Methylovirgula ligni]